MTMNRIPIFVLLAITTLHCNLLEDEKVTATPKAIYIIVDGISTDVLQFTPIPNIDANLLGSLFLSIYF